MTETSGLEDARLAAIGAVVGGDILAADRPALDEAYANLVGGLDRLRQVPLVGEPGRAFTVGWDS
ncbi:hypothetical protein [Streptomyces sp. NPDC056821]|uniref:hypothetical protein n=1 Tax=unclassified Streptomyces TaxID=2593676 RepID=UPI0036CF34FD